MSYDLGLQWRETRASLQRWNKKILSKLNAALTCCHTLTDASQAQVFSFASKKEMNLNEEVPSPPTSLSEEHRFQASSFIFIKR